MGINQRPQIPRTLGCRGYVLRMLSLTDTGSTNIRDSLKRTADSAGLDEGEKGGHRSKKTQREGQCAGSVSVGVSNNSSKTLS